ncbi:hypothetical protein C8A01DRAFT_15369 [Parachaetomium inaequale]|uniref:MYND-type domain-containing protein n=1 Tax=Parachaetomium inaequale TaxID=2588326 RepID=A0AAN6PIW3_9PEZI|nr:hypothetical protein C8A01DRAFT_15369 [Parachaetomium inaequale]
MHHPRILERAVPFHVGSFDPAVSLTEDLPQGVDADILLLGCGDACNILYTSFVEQGLPERKLDITACDVDEHIIARNVLFFTILLDDDNVSLRQIWNIYYHFYLDNPDIRLVESQAKKLVNLAQDLHAWRASPYGTTLRFCDEKTLSLVRSIWAKYADEARFRNPYHQVDRDHWAPFSRALEEARTRHGCARQASRQDVSRSCAPLAMQTAGDLLFTTDQHWQRGVTDVRPLPNADPAMDTPEVPNPIFAVPLTTSSVLKHPTNPLLSFHLAAAQANLTELSPLQFEERDQHLRKHHRLFKMALMQFEAWTDAFIEAAPRTVIRFTASECFALCHTLRYNLETGETCAHHYRGKLGFDALRLAESEYGASGNAPKQFDVIDTSTLSHDVSILNLLVSAGPLLKDGPSSTLYTAGLHRMSDDPGFEKLLHGHTTTISILLGLVPAEYWTNAKTVSTADQVLTAWSDDDATPEAKDTIFGFRISWKQIKHMARQQSLPTLQVATPDLVLLLHNVYQNVFSSPSLPLRSASPDEWKRLVAKHNPSALQHPTTIAALLDSIGDRAQVDSIPLWEVFLHHIIISPKTKSCSTCQAAAFTLLAPPLRYKPSDGLAKHFLLDLVPPTFSEWSTIPKALAVTVVVPTERWKLLNRVLDPDAGQSRELTAHIYGYLRVPEEYTKPGCDILITYQDTQISFGTVTTHGSREDDDFAIHVQEDEAGWNGASPMIVSFYIPTDLVVELFSVSMVGFAVECLALNKNGFEDEVQLVQPEDGTATFYEVPPFWKEQVYITKHRPGQADYGVTERVLRSIRRSKVAAKDTAPSQITLGADFNLLGEIVSITGRVNITSAQGKKLLSDKAPISIEQPSPFTLDIVFGGKSKALTLPLTFPAPILKDGSRTRVARKSCYIEITALLAKPSANPATLDTFLLPTTTGSGSSPPATLNMPHLNLDALPILSLADKSRTRFLTTLTSLMFSSRERRLREQALASTTTSSGNTAMEGQLTGNSARLNFKESLFTLFMLASGQQGGQTGLFALTHADPQRGIQMLLFVSAVRLDGAHGSVVLDAAVLPFTREMVASLELEGFLLVLRTLECCTLIVDEDELRLWKGVLPALVERCRAWRHVEDKCEYVGGTVPVSLVEGEKVLCGCGMGKLPEEFVSLPEWEAAAKYATRVAISPVYASALVEELVDPELAKAVAEDMVGGKLGVRRCRTCRVPETLEGVALRKCTRCLEAEYCSAECQKKDWKKHRMECEEPEKK